jgi:DNA-binding IclR family transcriptional regulator
MLDEMNHTITESEVESSAFKSILRMALILRCISNGVNTVTEIAKKCNLHKSTVYRLLKTAEKAGFIVRDPFNRRYLLGPLVTEIASNPYVPHEQLVLCAIKEMTAISDYTKESIGLHVLTGFYNIMMVHEIPSTHDLRFVASNRMHSGLHTGASSKALLSQLKGRILKLVLNNQDFTPLTPYSITSVTELKRQLQYIRRLGYATDFSEVVEGIMCISVPIRTYSLPATMGILGPENRIKPKMEDYVNRLLVYRGKIEQNLANISSFKI